MSSKRRLRRIFKYSILSRKPTFAESECSRKIPYPSEATAQADLDALMRNRYYDRKPLHVYQCPADPRHYHVGHAR